MKGDLEVWYSQGQVKKDFKEIVVIYTKCNWEIK